MFAFICQLDRPRDGVARLECRDDSLRFAEFAERREGLLVGDAGVLTPARLPEHRVFGADPRVVESGRDGVDLDVVVDDAGSHPVDDVVAAGG